MSDFFDLVQKHERVWGEENYHERPDLAAIIAAPVVIPWLRGKEKRPFITLHESLEDVQDYLVKLLFRATVETPDERIVRIYQGQQQMRVDTVRIEFKPVG